MLRTRVRARLHRAFLLALATPTALACGGVTSPQASADGGPSTDGSDLPDTAMSVDTGSRADTGEQVDSSAQVDSDVQRDSGLQDDSSEPTDACIPDLGLPIGSQCQQYAWPPCNYDGGVLTFAQCSAICPVPDGGFGPYGCGPAVVNGASVISCYYCAAGRRAEGTAPAPAMGETPGSFLAHCAYLEAESVHAFRRLARELAAHAAPARLVARAERAAQEEVRHARAMSR